MVQEKTMALVTDTFSDHVVSETADTKGTPAVSDVVLCVNRSTVNGRPRKLTAEQLTALHTFTIPKRESCHW